MNKQFQWAPVALGVLLVMSTPTMATAPQATNVPASHHQVNSTLNTVIQQAIQHDFKRASLEHQSQAIRAQGVANATLSDPKLQIGAGNVPTDSWSLSDDSMTSLSVGISQQFARGNTLALKQQQAEQQSVSTEEQVELRGLTIARNISVLWLQLGYLNQVEHNLQQRLTLKQQLAASNESHYSLGQKKAQDVLDTQVAISQLEDKIDANAQTRQQVISQLSEWLGPNWLSSKTYQLAQNSLNWPTLTRLLTPLTVGNHYAQFRTHPLVKMADQAIKVKQTSVAIHHESYKPQFGVSVSYGYRQGQSMSGGDASDVVSGFLTMDLPVFTSHKQDQALQSAQSQLGASRLDRDLLLQQMNAKVNQNITDLTHLRERLKRYRLHLLPQSQTHLDAVKRAYDANTTPFDALVAATIANLSLKLDYQHLITQENQTKAQLAYWFQGFPDDIEHAIATHYQF